MISKPLVLDKFIDDHLKEDQIEFNHTTIKSLSF